MSEGSESWFDTWRDRAHAWRDGLLSSPAFQRRASRFPLTRGISRRRAAEVFDLVAGFVYSQVLLACVRLDLFSILKAGPATTAELAARWSMPAESAQRLLDAATALRLVRPRSRGRHGLGPRGAPMAGNAALVAMVEHHAALYQDLADPVALLRRTPGAGGAGGGAALSAYWPYAQAEAPHALTADRVAAYSTLMSASQPLVADEILDAYPLARHRRLLDVGGGEGRFLAAAAARAPHLQLTLFDLPAVAERARRRFASEGLAARAQVVGGDFLLDALPRGCDLASLVRVVHDHDDERALHILRAVRQALPDAGRLLLAEPMAGTPGAEAMGDAYFGFYLLAMGRGRPRSVSRLTEMLHAAGFARVRQLPTRVPLQTSLLLAECSL